MSTSQPAQPQAPAFFYSKGRAFFSDEFLGRRYQILPKGVLDRESNRLVGTLTMITIEWPGYPNALVGVVRMSNGSERAFGARDLAAVWPERTGQYAERRLAATGESPVRRTRSTIAEVLDGEAGASLMAMMRAKRASEPLAPISQIVPLDDDVAPDLEGDDVWYARNQRLTADENDAIAAQFDDDDGPESGLNLREADEIDGEDLLAAAEVLDQVESRAQAAPEEESEDELLALVNEALEGEREAHQPDPDAYQGEPGESVSQAPRRRGRK